MDTVFYHIWKLDDFAGFQRIDDKFFLIYISHWDIHIPTISVILRSYLQSYLYKF
jgi:hypothetical protein